MVGGNTNSYGRGKTFVKVPFLQLGASALGRLKGCYLSSIFPVFVSNRKIFLQPLHEGKCMISAICGTQQTSGGGKIAKFQSAPCSGAAGLDTACPSVMGRSQLILIANTKPSEPLPDGYLETM